MYSFWWKQKNTSVIWVSNVMLFLKTRIKKPCSFCWPLMGFQSDPSPSPMSLACKDFFFFFTSNAIHSAAELKNEGPDGRSHRLEECLPSGRENVISWDQQIAGQVLFLPSHSHFCTCASHACRALWLSPPPAYCLSAHAHTRKNDTFSFSYFLCFYILGPGVQEATLCFHVTKHTEVCVDSERWIA